MAIDEKLEEFVRLAREGLEGLAEATVKSAADAAKEDMRDYLAESEERLRKWAELLALGQLSSEDFEILVRSQTALLKFHRLVIAGKGKATIAKVRDGLTSLIVRAALTVLL